LKLLCERTFDSQKERERDLMSGRKSELMPYLQLQLRGSSALLKDLGFQHCTKREGQSLVTALFVVSDEVRRIATLTTPSAPEITLMTLARGQFNVSSILDAYDINDLERWSVECHFER